MQYYNVIILVVEASLFMMLSIVLSNRTLNKVKKTAFCIVFILIMVAASCEWIGEIINGYSGTVRSLHLFVKFLELSITPIFPVVYAKNIFYIPQSSKKKKTLEYLPIILLVIHTTLEFFSIFFGYIFEVDASGVYHHSNFYFIYLLALILSAAYFFTKLFMFSKYYQNPNFQVLLMIIAFLFLGVTIQFIYPSLRTTWLTVAVASVFTYIYYSAVMMNIDHLTKLLNQGCFKSVIENNTSYITIITFDIDHFKMINDTFGHPYGDRVLFIIAKVIKEVYSNNYNYCYRTGGDEFSVISTYNYSKDEIDKLNLKFKNRIDEIRKTEPQLPSVSIGCAINKSPEEAIYDADERMYANKVLSHASDT